MVNLHLNTPVVLIIFNRPDTTQRVFAAIRQAKPSKLLVIADGSRKNKFGEVEKCAAARKVIEQVDWDCKVIMNYADINMGCKQRVSSGLDWVFNIVEEAIILEDDCLPHPTFFRFCEELLNYYRNDERIMAISGNNFQFGRKRTEDSYYFSRYNHCWGWATWRRAWQYYDIEMKLWSVICEGGWLKDILEDSRAVKYWTKIFQSTYDERIDTWDYQWTFACWVQSSLSILPNVNLVSNIGFNPEATHTVERSCFADMAVEAMKFPLQHPLFLIRDAKADAFTQENIFMPKLVSRIKNKINKALKVHN